MTFEWRPLRESDASAWADLMAVVAEADGDEEDTDETEVRESFGDPYRDYEDGSAGIFDGPALIGYGVLTSRPAAEPRHEMRHSGGVHPSFRGKGLGGELLDWAERAARPLHTERFPGRPLSLQSGCVSGNTAAAALHEAHGYQWVRAFQVMFRDLSSPIAPAGFADGLRAEEFTAQRSEDARMVRNEAFRDHWGSTEVPAESWARMRSAGSFRSAYSFVVYEGSEPLGMLISHDHGSDLYIALVGTRAAGRKRGIATALLSQVLARAKADGYATASLSVDAGSLTGAVGLYERVGFTTRVSWSVYDKPLI
jgi:mycothiol synthase